MAITRLTDIIQVFEDKWTYGDVKFGYEGELNQDHDVKYPLLLIEPPESTIPEIFEKASSLTARKDKIAYIQEAAARGYAACQRL